MSVEEKAERIQRKLFKDISAEITDGELSQIKQELKLQAFGGFKAGEIQRELKTTDDILEKLKRKGLIKIGEYGILWKLADAIESEPIRKYVAQAENSLTAIHWPVKLSRGYPRYGPVDNHDSITCPKAKRQKTGETTEPPRDDTPSTSGQTSIRTLELIINKVADAISNDDDLMNLGLQLGVEQQHINRALETNWNGNEKSSRGNSLMLQNWAKNVKQSELLPTLRAALRETRLIRVEETCLPIEVTTLLPSTKDFDDIMEDVAKKIRKDSEIDKLGRKLGFTPEDIHGYIATNQKTQIITCDGTLQMLRDWQKGQKNSTMREGLKTALEQSGQIRLADELFSSS